MTVAPAGGATGTGIAKGDRPALRFAMAPGARVPLVCDRGFSCTPVPGATFALDGGFTLAAAGRTVTVTGLAIGYTARDDGAVIATLDRRGRRHPDGDRRLDGRGARSRPRRSTRRPARRSAAPCTGSSGS